jgi:ribonuclease D
MYMSQAIQYNLIETQDDLEHFYRTNKNVTQLAFDTEFVGEKRYYTLLCLVQVATVHGFYLIDSLKIKDLRPFLRLLEDPNILKITHAGENDYRLLYQNFETVPQNVFDTQVAAGFLGYGYPASFMRLVEGELEVRLDKGYAVTDWEIRPFKKKQLEYALNDVYYLDGLFTRLSAQLRKCGRLEWAMSEMKFWESPKYYERDPDHEALSSTLMRDLRLNKQVFLLRIYRWRREEAERKNYSKDMILPAKLISPILKNIDAGKQTLLDNRTIPNNVIELQWEHFYRLSKTKPTQDELDTLKKLPQTISTTSKQDISGELLHVLVKYKCAESGIASSLVFHKSDLIYALPGADIFTEGDSDWRKAFLGEALTALLNRRGELNVQMDGNQITLTMK